MLSDSKLINKNLTGLFLSFCSTFALIYSINLGSNRISITNSVTSLFIFFAFYIIITKSFNILNKRLFLVSYLLSVCFSTMLFIGNEIFVYENISLSARNILIKLILIICLSFIICAIVSMIIYYIPIIRDSLMQMNLEKFKYFTKSRKYFFLAWLFIFICWIPCLLAYFPGIFAYDIPWQVWQAFSHDFNAHHPICHTLYIYICLKVGSLLGSYNIGILIYSVSQMLILSCIFSYACCYISKLNVPVFLQIIAVLYFALFPVHPLFAINATKDILFSAFYLILFIKCFDMVLNPDEFFSNYKSPVIYLIFSVLMMCFRNQGIYVYILFIPFLVMFLKSNKKKAVLLSVLSIVVYLCFIGILNKSLDVKKGRVSEAMSVPLQQIARTAIYEGDNLTQDEKHIIYNFIDGNQIHEYNPYISDYIKIIFDEDYFKEHPGRFFKLWVKLGIKYPGIYLDSFLNNCLGIYYPDLIFLNKYISYTGHRYIETSIKESQAVPLGLKRTSLWPQGEKLYDKIAIQNVFCKIPVLSMLFSIAFFSTWSLLFGFTTVIYYKKYKFIMPLILLFILMLTVVVSPVILLRYVYPVFISIPVFFCLLFSDKDKLRIDSNLRRKNVRYN